MANRSGGQEVDSFFSVARRWVRGVIVACLGILIILIAFFGLGLLLSGLIFVLVTLVTWFVESRRDVRSYRSSPAASAVPWQCDLCGRRLPNRDAAFHHAAHDHPERDPEEARTHLSVASALPPS